MGHVIQLLRTAVGKKALMAVTGILLFGFVFGHMFGNLKLYMGPDAINEYAHHLRTMGEPIFPEGSLLWMFRLGLLAAVGAHVWAAWQVSLQSREARGGAYAHAATVQTTYAARTMRWGGVIILAFVLFHLADLTWGAAHPSFDPADVRANIIASFSRWPVAAFYVVANLMLGLHLRHGLWSLFQSLGWNNPRFNAWRRAFASAFALVVTLANVSFPVAVLLKVVQ